MNNQKLQVLHHIVIINKQMTVDETERNPVDVLKKYRTMYWHHKHRKEQKEA